MAHDLNVLDVVDPTYDDWQVAGNSIRPQRGLRCVTACEDIGRWAEGRVAVEHATPQALKHRGLIRSDAEMEQLHLVLRPRQGEQAVERRGVTMFVR